MEQALSVTTINSYLKQIIDSDQLLFRVKVFGEVSSYNISNRVVYFGLKDENALLNCMSFYVEDFNDIKIGDKVVVQGSPNYYIKGGRLSFNVEKIEHFGEGELYKNFLLLKQKLEKEGLFDLERKKPFPKVINKIGIVTSESGAVIQDIINIATRRNNKINLVLFPVKVQGALAENYIVKGINYFSNSDVDAVIVARGGGSEEDLLPFNTEMVARSVANCSKFIVSAVGHETNYTLVDFVADLRAPTPSAAAELLVKEEKSYFEQFNNYFLKLNYLMETRLEENKNKMKALSTSLNSLITNKMTLEENKLSILSNKLNSSNPLEILSKGYSKIEKDNAKVDSILKVKINDQIVCNLKDGKLKAVVKEIV